MSNEGPYIEILTMNSQAIKLAWKSLGPGIPQPKHFPTLPLAANTALAELSKSAFWSA